MKPHHAAPLLLPFFLPFTTAHSCSTLPSSLHLQNITDLPNPFTFLNGTPVATKADYSCRQAELAALFQRYELGEKPGPPDELDVEFQNDTITLRARVGKKNATWDVGVTYPEEGVGPWSAMIAYDALSIPLPPNVAILTFAVSSFAVQDSAASRNTGTLYELFPDASAGALVAWSWGVERILDAIEAHPEINIKHDRIGVTGCSRNGKGALVAGALDERIALTIPQESGSGGSACYRLSDFQLSHNQTVQTLSEIVTENVWFRSSFADFTNKTDTLPVDHHELAGLVAPRPLLVVENAAYEWLGPWSAWGCMRAGRTIYEALGVKDNMGFSEVGNHSHCVFPDSEVGDLNKFVNRFLLDEEDVETDVFTNDQGFEFEIPNRWVDWDVPVLS